MDRRDFLRVAALAPGAAVLYGRRAVAQDQAKKEPPAERFKMGIVSDELDKDPVKAFALGADLGLTRYSIRNLMGDRIPNVPEEALRVVDHLVESGVWNVVSVSPGTNKVPLVEGELDKLINEDLLKAIKLAQRWHCDAVNLFSWLKTTDAARPQQWGLSPSLPKGVVTGLKRMADLAEREKVVLRIETSYQSWGDTGGAVDALLDLVGSPRLKQLWDPSNSLRARAKWGLAPDAPERRNPTACLLDELKAFSEAPAEVHVRDAVLKDGDCEWAPLGKGMIDWKQVLDALEAKGFRGTLTIEHHLDDKPAGARHAVGYLRQIMG